MLVPLLVVLKSENDVGFSLVESMAYTLAWVWWLSIQMGPLPRGKG
jgi:hypothetical protein